MSLSLIHDLETALQETQSCAICWLEQRQVTRYLTGVSNDGVNNIPLRMRLAKKGGYCSEHSEQFVKVSQPLSSAILLESFLKQKLERAAKGKKAIQIDCEACEIKIDNRKSYAKSIQRTIKQSHIQDLLLKAQLCTTHIQLVAQRAPAFFTYQLTAQHDELMQNLAEFIRKYDYRVVNKEQHSQAEKESIKTALALLKDD